MLKKGPLSKPILIDEGRDDQFFIDKQLLPEAFEVCNIIYSGVFRCCRSALMYLPDTLCSTKQAACQSVGQKLTLRMHDGYDHSYYFISTFIEEHVAFHADALLQ